MGATLRIGSVVVIGCFLQLVFVLAWIILGRQDAGPWTKWSLGGLFVIASIAALRGIAAEGGWLRLLLCCGWLAVGSVVIYQVLGFTVFPGLVKDIDLFSVEYVSKTLAVLGLSFVGYLLLVLVVRLPRQIGNLMQKT
jgi:hypothetical protein